jgi:Predicted transcriptional regulator with C-terminal CBS domains
MESPILEIRKALGLSQRELAVICGISSASYICDVEKGLRPIGPHVFDLLERTHFDVASIVRQQQAYMEERRSEIMGKLEGLASSAGEL